MAGSEVKLLGAWPSPFVMRPRIALNIKSIKYDFLEQKFGPKSDLLLQSNPVYKKIPVLIHEDKSISESLVIVQYIDEVWTSGPSILPSDPYDHAMAHFWAAYIDDKWFKSLFGILIGQGEEVKVTAMEQVYSVLGLLEEGCYIGWLRAKEKTSGLKLLASPGLVGWVERFCGDEAVKEVMPETKKLMKYDKMRAAKLRSSNLSN